MGMENLRSKFEFYLSSAQLKYASITDSGNRHRIYDHDDRLGIYDIPGVQNWPEYYSPEELKKGVCGMWIYV